MYVPTIFHFCHKCGARLVLVLVIICSLGISCHGRTEDLMNGSTNGFSVEVAIQVVPHCHVQ